MERSRLRLGLRHGALFWILIHSLWLCNSGDATEPVSLTADARVMPWLVMPSTTSAATTEGRSLANSARVCGQTARVFVFRATALPKEQAEIVPEPCSRINSSAANCIF